MDLSESSLSKNLVVENKMGIHARPAAMIVRVANKYSDTEVFVKKDEDEVNGKSIMGLMMLAAAQGTVLTFVAKGPDAEELLESLQELFERKFEEN